MGKRGQPDTWTAPPKSERLEAKMRASAAQPEIEMSLDQLLNLATMNKSLPSVDFHGKRKADVRFEVDELLADNPGAMVRIIYGNGSGVMSGEVMSYLHQLSRGKAQKIDGYREDPGRASCVVKVK